MVIVELGVDRLAGSVSQISEAVGLQDGGVLHEIDEEVDRAVERHEEVGDVSGVLDPVRPLHRLAVVNLWGGKEKRKRRSQFQRK